MRTENRSIVHLNVADFAVAVERVVDSRLRERPVIVAAQGAVRAAVYDMSEEAFRVGVRKGMPLRKARKLCPDVRIIPPHPDHYERAMQALLSRTLPYSPLIESGEVNGHLFADLTGTGKLHGPPPDVAWRIRKAVKKDLGLDPIWSLAPNKLVAKVASRLVKPTGEYIVEAGEEEEFLRPLPIHLLPGLEREDLRSLREYHISRVEQATLWTPQQLGVVFGKRGSQLYHLVRGVDDSPVLPSGQTPPAVRLDHEFGEDTNDEAVIDSVLYSLVEKAGKRLRRRGRAARRVVLMLDYSDGVRIIRQKSAASATANDFSLFSLAKAVLALAWHRRVRIRHIRLICDRLVYPPAQMDLFEREYRESKDNQALVSALDQIRERFGHNSIKVGRTLKAA